MKKIKIQYTIEVDIEAMAKEYGYTKQEAVEHVKELAKSAGTYELIVNGYVKQEAEPHPA